MTSTLSKSSLAKYVREFRSLPRGLLNWKLLLTVITFALTGSPKGWDEGSTSAISQLESFQDEYGLNGDHGDDKLSNIVSLVNVGASAGALLSFFLNDRIGRIQSMRVYLATYAIGSLISCFSYGHYGALYTGRIVAGLGVGGCTVVGPMTIAEIAPKSIRGLMTLWFNVCMLTTQGIGVFTVFGVSTNISPSLKLQYQIPWFVQTFIPAIAIFLSFFAIESPRWLILKNRQQDALQALLQLRGLSEDHPYFQEEWSLMLSHINDEQSQHGSQGSLSIIKETFTVATNFRRVQLVVIAYILAQFSGANSITNYLPTIIGLIGVKGAGIKLYASGSYALAKAVFCITSSLLFIDVVGRRRSLMIGVTIQLICHSYLAGYLRYFTIDSDALPQGASDAALAFIYIHALGWAVGLYSLPYLFGAELWPNRLRSFGGALAQSFHWLFYFAITKATPSLLSSFNIWGAFVFFVAWCIIAFVFTFFCVPETSGLSLDEIDACFERPLYRMRYGRDSPRDIREQEDFEKEGFHNDEHKDQGSDHIERV
ncbi:general substrate transporter [Xylaria grammica]|nr:general substrate transporter [Xylaria grammica]